MHCRGRESGIGERYGRSLLSYECGHSHTIHGRRRVHGLRVYTNIYNSTSSPPLSSCPKPDNLIDQHPMNTDRKRLGLFMQGDRSSELLPRKDYTSAQAVVQKLTGCQPGFCQRAGVPPSVFSRVYRFNPHCRCRQDRGITNYRKVPLCWVGIQQVGVLYPRRRPRRRSNPSGGAVRSDCIPWEYILLYRLPRGPPSPIPRTRLHPVFATCGISCQFFLSRMDRLEMGRAGVYVVYI